MTAVADNPVRFAASSDAVLSVDVANAGFDFDFADLKD